MGLSFDFGKPLSEVADDICMMVVELKTIRQIADHYGCSTGLILKICSNPEYRDQYASARDYAADLLEADIYAYAEACTPESAPADRVRIDALKWIAARRAPKRYGDKVEQQLTGAGGAPLALIVEFVKPE